MAVSREAMASVAKIAATAQRRRSGGKPSTVEALLFDEVASVGMLRNSQEPVVRMAT
jgi:hypothetical protein